MEVKVAEPKTIEQVAMEKVSDPFSRPFPMWHVTQREKLEDVLKEGLIAEDFAVRAGKSNYGRNFDSPWNKKFVSVRKLEFTGWYPDLIDDVIVIVKPNDRVRSHRLYQTEYLVRNRIAPREFVGLYLGQQQHLEDVLALYQRLDPSKALPIYGDQGLRWPVEMTKDDLRREFKPV